MNQSKYMKNLSKHEMRLITKMRGINVKKSTSKIELVRILKKEDKITYKESPFKSIIQGIRNKLSKNGNKLIKNGLYYVEEMKNLTESQAKNIKEKLIKFQNELIRRNRIKIDNNIMLGIMLALHIMVLKILDICLMKMKMLKISDICLMKIKMNAE